MSVAHDKYLAWKQQRNAIPLMLHPHTSALMLIDMQEYFLHPQSPYACFLATQMPGLRDALEERTRAVVVPAMQRLLACFRTHHVPVLYTTVASERADGRDLAHRFQQGNAASLAKIQAVSCPPRSDAWAQIVAPLAPHPDELVLNKTTYSAFASTGLDRTLRHMGIETLVIGGVVTTVCVEATARDAADFGYQVILVEDGCAGYSPESHEATLLAFQGTFGRVRKADEVITLLAEAGAQAGEKAVVTTHAGAPSPG